MSDRKTVPTEVSVDEVIESTADERRREDAREGARADAGDHEVDPVVWGPSMIGFGRQPDTTADGKEREWFAVAVDLDVLTEMFERAWQQNHQPE